MAIIAYIAYGLPNIKAGYFDSDEFMINGPLGLLQASFYLTMSLGGVTYVVNYSSKAKNPVRDIPIVILLELLYCTQ